MPLKEYPTSGNPRRGFDKDLLSGVEITVSSLYGETITFRFLNTDVGTISAGDFAAIVITVTDGNVADATSFQIAEQDFNTDNSIASNTDVLINWNQSDALIHAQNLQAMILSNAFFAGKVQVLVTANGSDYDVTITWLSRGHQFTAGTSIPSPFTLVSVVEGTDVVLVEGYALAYQVWMDDGGDVKPITDLRAITPQIDATEQYASCEFEINDCLVPYLGLVFPYGVKNTAGIEANARKQFWITYGWREVDRSTGVANAIFHDFKETEKEWVVYTALQETDRRGLRLYLSAGDTAIIPEQRFLTRRPHFEVGRKSIGWLYAILDHKERFALGSVAYKYYVDRWNGSSWVNVSNSTIGTVDGVYRIPAHPGNLPTALSSSVTRYRTEIRQTVSSVEITYATQIWDISNSDPAMQVWFLGDLCAFEDFSFDSLTDEEIVLDIEMSLAPIRPYDNDSLANYGARISTGGRQVVSMKNFRKITGTVTAICDLEAFAQYVECFLNSPLKYYRFNSKYPQDTGDILNDEIQRSVFIDPETVVLRQDGDMVDFQVSFYYHKNLVSQI